MIARVLAGAASDGTARVGAAAIGTTAGSHVPAGSAWAPLRPVAVPLGLGMLLLAAAFHQEAGAAVRTWMQSTAYNHCVLVIPIAAFLLWERRSDIAGLTAKPAPWPALLGVPVALAWMVAERLGIMEGRQLAAVSFAELLFLAALGWRAWRAVAGPLLYLYFLVPFGAFLTPLLQDVTTFFIRHGLALLGIPAFIDGYLIEIPQGTFLVAEACAGLRFLIASIAFGCLYALMMYRSPLRRGVFVGVSVVVPIVANGFRGLGIVCLGYLLNSAQAAAADHVIYGWVFFSVVILLLIVLGLPFRQDGPAPPRRRAPGLAVPGGPAPGGPAPGGPVTGAAVKGAPVPHGPGRPWPVSAVRAAAAVAAVAVVGPLLSAGLSAAMPPPPATAATIDPGPGCAVVADGPANPGAPRLRTQRVACGGLVMDMTWEAFSPRATAAAVMAERQLLCERADTEGLTEAWLPDAGGQSRAWRVMRSGDPAYAIAASIWINGKPVRPGLGMRLRMALDGLVGSAHAPMVVTVTPAVSWERLTPAAQRAAGAGLVAFLQAHPELDARVGALSALP